MLNGEMITYATRVELEEYFIWNWNTLSGAAVELIVVGVFRTTGQSLNCHLWEPPL